MKNVVSVDVLVVKSKQCVMLHYSELYVVGLVCLWKCPNIIVRYSIGVVAISFQIQQQYWRLVIRALNSKGRRRLK
jgi:hypothetical protein